MPGKLTKRGKVWHFHYTTADGRRTSKRLSSDKRVAEQLARQIEDEQDRIRGGWIDERDVAYREQAARPLGDHVDDWHAFLLGKGDTQEHADTALARVSKLIALAGADRLTDLSLGRLQAALAALGDEGLALRTIHHYARLAKNFSRWLWRDGRTREDLLAHLQPPEHPETDRRRERRAFTVPELERLIAAAERGPVRRRISGPDRAMLYRITAGTGFRSEEMQSLTPESFDLDDPCPTITVEARDSKRRRRDVQPIQPALASLLKPWLVARPKVSPSSRSIAGRSWRRCKAICVMRASLTRTSRGSPTSTHCATPTSRRSPRATPRSRSSNRWPGTRPRP
jgi:integrase